jgi:arylsulfatase A-like enzyme
VDDQIGAVIEAVDRSPLRENTIIVLTSDHGYNMGEKDYLFKNSLWEESTRVPLVVRAPGVGTPGSVVEQPVSLIDVYPTLVDLCELKGDTRKSSEGVALEGYSLKPLMQGLPWDGPEAALSVINGGPPDKIAGKHFSVRTGDWRYILYADGSEELYDHTKDPYEWTNLAADPAHAQTKARLRRTLLRMTGRAP